jgi:hypothetical protein
MFKWSEVFELIELHVFTYSHSKISKLLLCVVIQQRETVWLEAILITAPTHSTPHEHAWIKHYFILSCMNAV